MWEAVFGTTLVLSLLLALVYLILAPFVYKEWNPFKWACASPSTPVGPSPSPAPPGPAPPGFRSNMMY